RALRQRHPLGGAARGRSTRLDAAGFRFTTTHQGVPHVIRTHDAGSLRSTDTGTQVTLAGWVARRRDHGGVTFIDLRDSTGVAQVVVRDEAIAHQLRSEYCLRIVGTVADRPDGNANDAIPTGDIEV